MIVVNIDMVFIVCGLDVDFNLCWIECYLLFVGGGGV